MEANEAMKAMARMICAKIIEGDSDNPLRVMKANRYLSGMLDDDHHMAIALAAIMETTELATKLVENWNRHPSTGLPHETSANIAERIERGDHLVLAGEHYALAGDRHG